MVTSFIKQALVFIYTKDSNQPLNIIISRISTYENNNDLRIIIDMSGENIILKFETTVKRDAAKALLDLEFC